VERLIPGIRAVTPAARPPITNPGRFETEAASPEIKPKPVVKTLRTIAAIKAPAAPII
jgi:hypothetical protein